MATTFFEYINPLDSAPMRFDALANAIASAKYYIGKEDAWADTITEIRIHELRLAATVTREHLKGEQ